MLPAPDPTLALLLATLRWPDDDVRRSVIASRASAGIDWARFRALADRHRVAPLALQGLAAAKVDLPPSLSDRLEQAHQAALFAEMAKVHELDRLRRQLGPGLEPIVLKGPVTSLRAFGQLGMRTYRDLDLLVREEQVEEILSVLHDAGYELVEPLLDMPDDWSGWRKHHKDMVLQHEHTQSLVEVHWRLFDNRSLMPRSALAEPRPLGQPPLEAALVLPIGTDLRYHCVHGALHGWSRLRWLADVNAMLAAAPELALEIDPIEPAIAQTLILCRDLLGAVWPRELDAALSTSKRGRALARLAWSEILRSGIRELEDVRFGSTVKNLSHYAFMKDRSCLMEELRFDMTAEPRVQPGKVRRKGRIRDWLVRHL